MFILPRARAFYTSAPRCVFSPWGSRRSGLLWFLSSIGQSVQLITGIMLVQGHQESPPGFHDRDSPLRSPKFAADL